MREIYIEPDQYAALIAALANLKPANPFGTSIEESDIMVALGEGANIWPSSVLDDPANGYRLKRTNHALSAVEPLSPPMPEDEDDF